jgi:dihydrofolate reductase
MAPLVLGKGKRLFSQGTEAKLRLLDSKAYSTGMLRLSYAPASA